MIVENNQPTSSQSMSKHKIETTSKLVSVLAGTTFLSPKSLLRQVSASEISYSETPITTITNLLFVRHAQSNNNVIYDSLRNDKGQLMSPEEAKIKRRILRQSDCLLSSKGLEQVNLLQSFFQQGGISKSINMSPVSLTENSDVSASNYFSNWIIVSSPMKRALLTSMALSKGLSDKPVYVNPSLFEAGGCYAVKENGDTQGLSGSTANEIESSFPNYTCLSGMENGWYHGRSSKMETAGEFHTRVNQLAEWIWSIHNANSFQNKFKRLGLSTSSKDNKDFQNIIIVGHGTLFSALLSKLQGGDGLITHYNTGYSHLQLISSPNKAKIAAIKFINKCEHINSQTQNKLLTGSDTIEDRWLEEYQKYM